MRYGEKKRTNREEKEKRLVTKEMKMRKESEKMKIIAKYYLPATVVLPSRETVTIL